MLVELTEFVGEGNIITAQSEVVMALLTMLEPFMKFPPTCYECNGIVTFELRPDLGCSYQHLPCIPYGLR